ncbi:hypothetical protein GA0070607_5941 [Micromonospora coriariae]|uniref:Polyketide cyclase / dehydrase and lipid transport n=1 Tax=Micromonospora coriariae TaxID=285665 RepID=A0A1C4XY62_9ACTN|nr:hypothetical protein GA0070607_5941 [Micromonospora coriariae]
MHVLGSRRRSQPAPPHIVWRSLRDPYEAGSRPWLELRDDEVAPRVVAGYAPVLLIWSSLWPHRPLDRIRFDLAPGPPGSQDCDLRWTLTTDGELPGESTLGYLRHRLNYLINNRLRLSYGQ